MSTYIYSKWLNAPLDHPREFYSELDANRCETRKIEVYANGRVGFASLHAAAQGTQLGREPVPPLAEIRAQPEFEIEEISAKAFEAKWSEVQPKR